jgi:eukaryotic translation initiation factor 2C
MQVNVNVCMSAFYEPCNLVQAIQAFQQNSRGAIPSRFVSKLTVRTRHNGHKKQVKRIMSLPASKTTFDCEEYGGKITVAEFFKRSAFELACVKPYISY